MSKCGCDDNDIEARPVDSDICVETQCETVRTTTCTCRKTPCCCGRTVAVPQRQSTGCCTPTQKVGQPYYQKVSSCPEDNTKVIIERQISQIFLTESPFCMPACGAKIRVQFSGLTDAAIGAYLWAYGIGYLEITGYNANYQELELENPCLENNCQPQAAPGTPIPKCTPFILSVPPCGNASSGGDTTFPFLASGFVAPDDGDCIDISLTNVNGIAVNKNISINNGIYRVSAVKSATLITICNDGQGLTPGTVVNYQDSAGNYIVPIILIDSNPCNSDSVTSGIPLVCSSGVTVPLEGSIDGQFLVWNEYTGQAEFQSINIDVLNCQPLIVPLVLDPALGPSYEYPIQVADNSGFTAGMIIEIVYADTTYEFTVAGTSGSTIVNATLNATVAELTTIPLNTAVCEQSCCLQLDTRVTAIEDQLLDQELAVSEAELANDTGILNIDVGAGNYVTRSGSATSLTLTNPNPNRSMIVFAILKQRSVLNLYFGSNVEVQMIADFGAGPLLVGSSQSGITDGDTTTQLTITSNNSYVYSTTLAPGGSVTIDLSSRVLVYANPDNNSYWNSDTNYIDALGVVV